MAHNNPQPIDCLVHKIDPYNGVHVKMDNDPTDELKFGRDLQVSLQKWQKDGRKGVWITLPPHKAYFIPILIELGFQFNYCDPENVVLTKWLPKTPNTLPVGPRHLIGVGGYVVNQNKEILVVKEKHGITSIWKLPGGSVDHGEDIEKAAVREVLEETGIQTEFISILCFRTHHGVRFGLTDVYFTCLLKPLNNNIVIQESEIAEAKWMPIEEFLAMPYWKLGSVYGKIMDLGYKAINGEYRGFNIEKLPGFINSTTDSLFYSSPRL